MLRFVGHVLWMSAATLNEIGNFWIRWNVLSLILVNGVIPQDWLLVHPLDFVVQFFFDILVLCVLVAFFYLLVAPEIEIQILLLTFFLLQIFYRHYIWVNRRLHAQLQLIFVVVEEVLEELEIHLLLIKENWRLLFVVGRCWLLFSLGAHLSFGIKASTVFWRIKLRRILLWPHLELLQGWERRIGSVRSLLRSIEACLGANTCWRTDVFRCWSLWHSVDEALHFWHLFLLLIFFILNVIVFI